MAKGKPYGYIFLIALALIVILAGPSLFRAGTAGYSKFWEDFWAPFKKNGDQDDFYGEDNETFSGRGHTALGLKIYYRDGTVKEFTVEEFSFLPLTIYDNGKEVEKIEPIITLNVDWTGVMKDWLLETNFKMTLLGVNLLEYTGLSYDFASDGDLPKGSPKSISMGTISVTSINNELMRQGQPSGNYKLKVQLYDTSFTLTELNDTPHTESIDLIESIWTFYYEKVGIDSLSIEIHMGPIYL